MFAICSRPIGDPSNSWGLAVRTIIYLNRNLTQSVQVIKVMGPGFSSIFKFYYPIYTCPLRWVPCLQVKNFDLTPCAPSWKRFHLRTKIIVSPNKWKKSKVYVNDRTHPQFYNFEDNNLVVLLCLANYWKQCLEPANICETPLEILGTSSEMSELLWIW